MDEAGQENQVKGVVVREGGIDDIEAMRTIQRNDGYEHAYYLEPDRLEKLLKRGETFFLAYFDGKPIGFSSVDFEVRARLHFLSVLETESKRGVGSALMRTMLEESRRRGYKSAHTYVEANSTKEDFLRRFGFDNIGKFGNRYGQGKDATIWSIDLNKE